MIKTLSLLPLLFASVLYGQECKDDRKIQEVMTPCQMSYYKYAPTCTFGDGACLSLVLQGLVNKNLFDYRPEIRRVHNTPLKRKLYQDTSEYAVQYKELLKDLKEADKAMFCAEMNTYWLYDLTHKGFLFPPNTLFSKTRLYRLDNVPHAQGYDLISAKEKEAIEIEGWEGLASSKFLFFKLSTSHKGFVAVDLTHFAWFIPSLRVDHEGDLNLTYEEGCRSPSHFIYGYKK